MRFLKSANGPSCIRVVSCLCRCSLVRLSWIVGVGLCKTTCHQTRKPCMRWWRCVRCHARKNGFVSHAIQECFGIVLTFPLPHMLFVMCTIAHREVLHTVRSEKHVGVMTTQHSLDSTAHTRDAKRVKSLASRLDEMRRNPKF